MAENKSLEISGKVIQHLKVESGQGKNGSWQKQSFIIETDEQYPKKIMLTCWNDMVNNIPRVGTSCTAGINIESKEYNEKWFTNVNAWTIKAEKEKW